MSAKVIELRPGLERLPRDPSVADRALERWLDCRQWLSRNVTSWTPIVVARRARIQAREDAAVEFGKTSVGATSRR